MNQLSYGIQFGFMVCVIRHTINSPEHGHLSGRRNFGITGVRRGREYVMLVILRTVCNGEVLLSVTVVQRHKGCSLT